MTSNLFKLNLVGKKWLKMCSTKKEQKEQIISSVFLDIACYWSIEDRLLPLPGGLGNMVFCIRTSCILCNVLTRNQCPKMQEV
jgi:hypothetical protein